MRILLFLMPVLTAVTVFGCACSHVDPKVVDSLEQKQMQLIERYQLYDDTSAVKEALEVVDRLIALKPGNVKYKMNRLQLLIFDQQYDSAKSMLVNEKLAPKIFPTQIFPDYEKHLLVHLDMLKAHDSGDSLAVKRNLSAMQKILRDWIFSDSFDLEDFCENYQSFDQEIIFKDSMFLKWLNVRFTQGGREAVMEELDEIGKKYDRGDNLHEIRSEYYGYNDVMNPYIFM